MRSRYTAFALRDEDYLFRTWHPRTRPAPPYWVKGTQWTGLTILGAEAGGLPTRREPSRLWRPGAMR